MMSRSEMLPVLVGACPSFTERWEKHKLEYSDEIDFLPYVALSELSDHLIYLLENGTTSEFPAIFSAVERLHIEGENYVKEAVTIGLLEGLQNRFSHLGQDSEVIKQYLLPVSRKWWDQLDLFWDGKINYVGETTSI